MQCVDLVRQARRAGVLAVLIALISMGHSQGRSETGRGLEPSKAGVANDGGRKRPAAAAVTIEVADDVQGKTPTYLGGTEGAAFYISDLLDLGFNTYGLYTDMSELEWVDDDDYSDGVIDGDGYGTPSKTQIKNDKPAGFRNRVPWPVWDANFNAVRAYHYGTVTRRAIIQELVDNGIEPIVMLRMYNAQNVPELRPTANWAPRPDPIDVPFKNEWWEHCFAVAYWLNVRNDFGITHFVALNEPEIQNPLDPTKGQGWKNYGGTRAEYVTAVKEAYGAVKYANDIAGLPTYLHAPVVGSNAANGVWIPFVLDKADPHIQVVNFHKWDPVDAGAVAAGVRSQIVAHNTDGVVEPMWVSEWGTFDTTATQLYTTMNRAMMTADQLMGYAEREVWGLTIYNTYQWAINPVPPQSALIHLQDDGAGGVIRVRTETYYAYRLLLRALNRAKQRLAASVAGLPSDGRVMVTRDADALYVLVNRGGGTVDVDLSALAPCYEGAVATVYEYSSSRKDEVQSTPVVLGGQLTFSAPANGLALAEVPRGC